MPNLFRILSAWAVEPKIHSCLFFYPELTRIKLRSSVRSLQRNVRTLRKDQSGSRHGRIEHRTKSKKDSCATFRASMIPRASFVAARALHIKLVANYMMVTLCLCPLLFADVPGTARCNTANPGQ